MTNDERAHGRKRLDEALGPLTHQIAMTRGAAALAARNVGERHSPRARAVHLLSQAEAHMERGRGLLVVGRGHPLPEADYAAGTGELLMAEAALEGAFAIVEDADDCDTCPDLVNAFLLVQQACSDAPGIFDAIDEAAIAVVREAARS